MTLDEFRCKISFIICLMFFISLNERLFVSMEVSNNDENFALETFYQPGSDSFAISTSLADVIDVFFVQQEIPFDILMFGSNSRDFTELIEEIGRRNKGRYHATVKWYPDESYWSNEFVQSAVLIFEDEFRVKSFLEEYLTKLSYQRIKFIFYCKIFCDIKYTDQLYDHGIRERHVQQLRYYLYDSGETLELLTIDWWTQDKCHDATKTIINIFSKTTMKWNTKLKNYEKFQNFYGCQLTLDAQIDNPIYDPIDDKFKSHLFEIFKIMGQLRNFTPNLNVYTDDLQCIPTNNACMYTNVNLFWAFLTELELGTVHIGTTFAESTLKFLISPGKLYTSYEKLLLPFDESTWWFLIATFCGAFFVIFIVNRMPKFVRNLLYGERVHMPAFNVVGTFFGIGQIKLPEGNFARIILITFIFFCLIIRTAYQGVQFDMMTKEMRRKPAQSVQQLYDENYTFLAEDNTKFSYTLKNMIKESERSNIKLVKSEDWVGKTAYCGLNSSVKQAIMTTQHLLPVFNKNCPNNPVVLNEDFLVTPSGIATVRNHFLFPALEEALQLTIQFGIPQHNLEDYYALRYNIKTQIDEKREPQVLAFGDLDFGFVIWLVACGASFCVFLCELCSFLFVRKEIAVANEHTIAENQVDIDPSQYVSILNPKVEEDLENQNENHKENHQDESNSLINDVDTEIGSLIEENDQNVNVKTVDKMSEEKYKAIHQKQSVVKNELPQITFENEKNQLKRQSRSRSKSTRTEVESTKNEI